MIHIQWFWFILSIFVSVGAGYFIGRNNVDWVSRKVDGVERDLRKELEDLKKKF